MRRIVRCCLAVFGLVGFSSAAVPQAASPPNAMPGGKPATEATRRANAAVLRQLNFDDKQDFEDAKRGLLARPDQLTIKGADGHVVWDMERYKTYIGDDKAAPDTVNPSLWRNAQLNMQYGLFEVVKGIYQVRGYDLSNITFVQGKTGWIVGDPLISAEMAKAAYELVSQRLGKKPIVAVIYSHSHADHFGGVRGIVDEADVKAGKVKILAPESFTEEAVAENIIAGNAMNRRATYMYGVFLPRNATGGVNNGLGQTTSNGTVGMPCAARKRFSRARCCATCSASGDGRTGTIEARTSVAALGTFSNSKVTTFTLPANARSASVSS